MRYTPLVMKGYCSRPVFPKKMWFKEILPMSLSNAVSGKSERLSGAVCIQELSVLLACLKKAEFVDSVCEPEFKVYSQCIGKEKAARQELSAAMKKGILGSDDSRKLSFFQVNTLMDMYPQPGSRTGKIPQKLPTVSYADPMWDKAKKTAKRTKGENWR